MQAIKPSNRKNLLESKNEKCISRTYTFDVTKCDKIFDMLVADRQIIVPKGTKVPQFEQRKKKGFYKFHNFLGHNTSQSVLFRNLVQNALKDGILKFVGKLKPRPEEEIETKVEALFVEPVDIMVVDTIASVGDENSKPNDKDQMTKAYPKAEEELVDFMNRCGLKDSEVMLCPKCNLVYEKDAAK